jgi:hypothetical protein
MNKLSQQSSLIKKTPVKTNQKIVDIYSSDYKPEGNTFFEQIPHLAQDAYLYDQEKTTSDKKQQVGNRDLNNEFFYEPTSSVRNEYLESIKALDKQAKDLKNSSQYSDTKKTILTQEMLDNNPYAIEVELERLQKIIPSNQKTILNTKNEETDISRYKSKLKDQSQNLKSKLEYQDLETSASIMGSSGRILDVKPSENLSESTGRRDLESLERLIRARQENIADIQSYIFGLVTGVEQFSAFAPNIAHSNAKFIKLADQPLEEEVLEPVEEYFDNLYNDTPGSPNYGKLMTHPDKHRNQLSTEAQSQTSQPKFKKK